jgi:hypothetical protein
MSNNTIVPIKPAIDVALFIDNDIGHTENVMQCGETMYVMKVGELPANELLDLSMESDDMKPFVAAVEKGAEGAKMVSLLRAENKKDKYDKESGIRKTDCDTIKDWVIDMKKDFQHPAVLFDFDRTLSVVEGMRLNYLDENKIDIEGFVEYYMGGIDRLTYLRDLFRSLFENGVSMFILTNNTGCATTTGFEQVCRHLFQPYPIHIICGQLWDFDKYTAAADVFPSVCSYPPIKQGPVYANNNNNNTNRRIINALRANNNKPPSKNNNNITGKQEFINNWSGGYSKKKSKTKKIKKNKKHKHRKTKRM